MNLKLKISSIALLFTAFFFGQEVENALLWEITNKENKQTSFLFGTMHVGCNVELNDEIRVAFEQADILLLEIDLTNPEMAVEMRKHMFMRDGKTLLDLISEDEYQLLSNYINPRLAPQGINLEVMKNVKPILLSTMLMQSLMDCDNPGSFDMQLARLAQEMSIEVMGLETIEQQMDVFNKIPEKKQAQMLLESAKDEGKKDQLQLQSMMDAYQAQNLNALQQLAKEDTSGFIEFEEEILINRNKNWIPLIQKYMTEHSVVIGVGALHLVGEQGLLNLLKNEGFEVSPVR